MATSEIASSENKVLPRFSRVTGYKGLGPIVEQPPLPYVKPRFFRMDCIEYGPPISTSQTRRRNHLPDIWAKQHVVNHGIFWGRIKKYGCFAGAAMTVVFGTSGIVHELSNPGVISPDVCLPPLLFGLSWEGFMGARLKLLQLKAEEIELRRQLGE